jgi:hypothetical protein
MERIKNNKCKALFFISLFLNIFLLSVYGGFVYKKGGISYLKRKLHLNGNQVNYTPLYHHFYSIYKILPNTDAEIIFRRQPYLWI